MIHGKLKHKAISHSIEMPESQMLLDNHNTGRRNIQPENARRERMKR
jgi:hypothetical protein